MTVDEATQAIIARVEKEAYHDGRHRAEIGANAK